MNYLKIDNCPIYNTLNKRNKLFLYTYIFEAKTQSEAYKVAYKRDTIDDTCHANAHKLLGKTSIKEAYDEVVTAYASISKEELIQKVRDISINSKRDTDRLRALELILRAEGHLSDVTSNTAIFNNIEPSSVIEALSHKRHVNLSDDKKRSTTVQLEAITDVDTSI